MYLCVTILLAVSMPNVQAYNRNPSGILKISGRNAHRPAGSLSYFRWHDNFAGSKYILSSCQMEEQFVNKEKEKCTLGVKLNDKTKVSPDEDTTVEVKCGETTCTYTGKPYHCDKFSKTQKTQIQFYECIIKQLTQTKACDEPELKCIKMCKTVAFKKAEDTDYLLY